MSLTLDAARLSPHSRRRGMLFAPVALIAVVFPVMLAGACAGKDSSPARSQDARYPEKITGLIDPTDGSAR